MFFNTSEDSLTWELDSVKSKKKVKDWGPDDFVMEVVVEIPWAMKYIMNIPGTMAMRCVVKKDFPSVGCHNYLILPYDMAKG